VFVLDSSGSIRDNNPSDGSYDNWQLMLEFMVNVVDRLTIGQDDTRVGVVKFSDIGESVFYLNSYYNKEDMKSAIRGIEYVGSNTNTSGGIKVMRESQFVDNRGDRSGVDNIAIVITDGVSTYDADRTIPEAQSARDQGIKIYSVGVTTAIDENELRQMSSDPQTINENYFTSASFQALDQVVDTLVSQTCSGVTVDCRAVEMDLVFVLDGSSSVGNNNWDRMLDFVDGIVDRMTIGQYNSRVGVVVYSDSVTNVFYLNSYYNSNDLRDNIRRISYPGGQTNTAAGIRAAYTEQFTESRGDRLEVHNVLILLTDGVSNIDQSRTVPEALAAKNRGITIFAVGITNSVNQEEIRDISTNPQQLDSNYFLTADFNSLDGISETLIKSACRPSYGSYCRMTSEAGLQCFCPHGRCDHRPTNSTSCLDVNECNVDNAGCEGDCINTDGGYRCECGSGLELDRNEHSCIDVNECNNNPCSGGDVCINTLGSYVCLVSSGVASRLVAADPALAGVGVAAGAATAGNNPTTLIAVSVALTAVLTALAVGAVIISVRAVRRWRASKNSPPPRANTSFGGAMQGFSNYASKFGGNQAEDDLDNISITPSSISSLS